MRFSRHGLIGANIAGIFLLYAFIDVYNTLFEDTLVLFILTAALSASVLLFGVLTLGFTGSSGKKRIVSAGALAAVLLCLLSGEWTLGGFEPGDTLGSALVLLLPLFALWSLWLLDFETAYFKKFYRWGVAAVVIVYCVMAAVTWITGSIWTPAGFSVQISGWYAGTAVFGAVIFLVLASDLLQSRRVVLPSCTVLLLGITLLLSGSTIAVFMLEFFCITLLAGMAVQQLAAKTKRFHSAFLIILVVLAVVGPSLPEYLGTRTSQDYPVPEPTQKEALASGFTDWQTAIGSYDTAGCISHLDRTRITRLSGSTRIDEGVYNAVFNDYVSMRLKTANSNLNKTSIQDNQFQTASLQNAGIWQWMAGYGAAWFDGYNAKIENGFAYFFGCYGLIGISLYVLPAVYMLIRFIRKMKDRRRYASLSFISSAAAFAYMLMLIFLCGGVTLHPVMLLFVFVPLIFIFFNTTSEGMEAYTRGMLDIPGLVKRGAIIALCGFIAVGPLVLTKLGSIYARVNTQHESASDKLTPQSLQPEYAAPESDPMEKTQKDDTAAADAFLNGIYGGYVFGDSIDWDLPGITNPTTIYRFHGMLWLGKCIDAWKKTKDERYIKKAVPLMMSWIDRYPVRSKSDPPYAWNDDSTARRCYYISMAYTAWNAYLTDAQKRTIEASMAYHARLLSDGSFYTWHQNHGLFQDRALLLYSVTFNNPHNTEYQAIVKDRVLTYAQSEVLKDGVNAEHSPAYHLSVADLLMDMATLFKDIDPEYSRMLSENYVDKMSDYATYLTRPDGTYPPLGDSGTSMIVVTRWLKNPNYLYAATKGAEGVHPSELDRVYPYGGYAIFRNSWKFDKNTDWIMFAAATHGGSHKHHDDLSFVIWHHGDLFTDGGSAGYNYFNDPMALYGVSPWAHSVLVSDWNKWRNAQFYKYRPTIDENGLATRITDSDIAGTNVSVTGIQKRIAGITQVRTLSWDKQKNIVTISDRVTSKLKNDYHMFLFQLAEDITPMVNGNAVTLCRGNVREAEMTFASSHPYDIRLYQGGGDELIQGFNAATGAQRYIVGIYFENVNDALELQTQIRLLG